MTYSLKVKFSQETVQILNKTNATLCCFLSYETENKDQAYSLCWNTVTSFLELLNIKWEYSLNAYISLNQIRENEEMCIPEFEESLHINKLESFEEVNFSDQNTCSHRKIDLKQRLLIQDYGKLSVDRNNDTETVLIENDSTTRYTSGISIYNTNNKQFFGNCAFNTYGKHVIKVAPGKKIFLMFSSKSIKNSTVILMTESPGILVEMPNEGEYSRTIYYDINTGWNSENQVWSKDYPSGTDLTSILIS